MGYSSIFWLPVCAVLSGIGLGLTYYYGRRRGMRAMLRGAAWSLIPIAVYLTGSIELFWKIGDAIGKYASAFVFSPVKWAGIGVAGLIVVLFFTTSGRERRKAARLAAKQKAERKAAESPASSAVAPAGATASLPAATLATSAGKPEPATTTPAKGSRKAARTPVDDDMRDIEEILRNRGI
jgi:uncharacterized membrane protein YcjF (UPF0283 family)